MEPEKNLHLPQTAFNQRANGAAREPELNKFWRDNDVFNARSAANTLPEFVLHDGPPYANGDVHMGHVLNKTLKDVVNKYKLVRGHKVRFVPGWDCHGLPTELQATKKRRYDNVGELRDACAAVAGEFIGKQRDVFERLGFTGDWRGRYATMDPAYEAAELLVFGELFKKGLVYRDKKPVHFSPSTQTVLAEAELEYMERTDTAAYVVFPGSNGTNLVVWTTMPWTLLGNKAIAVHPSVVYAHVRMGNNHNEELVVAEDLVERLSVIWGERLYVVKRSTGAELAGMRYTNYLTGNDGVVIADRFVSANSGTGLVHLCPAHGLEDFVVCQAHGIVPTMVAGFNGKFDPEVAPGLQHLSVLGEGSDAVLDRLQECVLHQHQYVHSYPHDWRTKKPVLFMLTEQFFIDVESLKADALRALEEVAIDNPVHRNRLVSMLQGRKDWCISRQRKWGLPIPVFVHADGSLLCNDETLAHLVQLVRAGGSNTWFDLPVSELLPPSYADTAHQYEKVTDTLDVWFDSGSSWSAVLGGEQADVYFEGSDQHRGWFQSSLLTCVALTGKAPYRRLLTHGFVLDDKGRKMSKSEGNVVDPLEMLQKTNADVMRLWCVSVDYTEDVALGENVMKQMVDAYFKLRNSFRFLLGNLFDYDPGAIYAGGLALRDREMIHRFGDYKADMLAAYDAYDFRKAFQLTTNFFANMSKDYFDLENKGILYELAADDLKRRSVQYVMHHLVDRLAPLLAPMVPYLAEDVHQHRPDRSSLPLSVFFERL